ncbi:MAG TPA: hypothetical protein VJL87_04990, partial [Bdellovibrionota bacterium]|nr:hypothetical protein [Bdellovibrionota bacterium]
MKEKVFLTIVMLFFGNSFVLASTPDLPTLRKSFEPALPKYDELFKRAETLHVETIPFGKPISHEECEKTLKKIKGKHFLTCGEKTDKKFLKTVSVKNHFGIPSTYVLQITDKDDHGHFIGNILLNASYEILEVTSADYHHGEKDPVHYSIFSYDAKKNNYEAIYSKGASDHYEIQYGVSSADGAIPRGIRTIKTKAGNPKIKLETNYYLRSLIPQWKRGDSFDLPNSYESLTVGMENGKEVCASGT